MILEYLPLSAPHLKSLNIIKLQNTVPMLMTIQVIDGVNIQIFVNYASNISNSFGHIHTFSNIPILDQFQILPDDLYANVLKSAPYIPFLQ